jgi:hypothetical protein
MATLHCFYMRSSSFKLRFSISMLLGRLLKLASALKMILTLLSSVPPASPLGKSSGTFFFGIA